MANMIAAFFSNTKEPSLFENLSVAKQEQYRKHVGHHDVIYIDFSEMPQECHAYQEYISRIQDGLVRDIPGSVSGTYDRKERSGLGYSFIGFDKTGHKFIFVMDEWDAVFHMSFITERDRENYLLFSETSFEGKELCGAGLHDRCPSDCKIFGWF